jgi:hypothetical protein
MADENNEHQAPIAPTIEDRLAKLEEAHKGLLTNHAAIVAKLKQHGIEVPDATE